MRIKARLFGFPWSSINRNIVECKFFLSCLPLARVRVLIETLWNVNRQRSAREIAFQSINRNIVECKSLTPFINVSINICINRNIVECK